MMDYPLVSVVIPTFNAASLLSETIDSVLGQTYTNIEIIVIDDGSTDDTQTVLRNYGSRLKYFQQENSGGPARPRNVGIRNAAGDLLSLFDSDDLMLPDKLSCAVEVFQRFPEVDFTFSNFRGIDEKGEIHRENYLEDYLNFRRELHWEEGAWVGAIPGRKVYHELLSANFIGTSSVVCRKGVFEKVGPFDEAMLNADDVDMWRRMAYAGFHFAYIDKVLHSYRKSPGGVTARGVNRYPAILKGLTKQFDLELEPEEIDVLCNRIHKAQLGYGSALYLAGDYSQSRLVFREALEYRRSLGAVKGLIKSWLLPLFSGRR